MTTYRISLLPLTLADHAAALQQVYRRSPHYWRMYNLAAAPAERAAADLQAAAETPGRTIMGIARPFHGQGMSQAAQIVGLVDFRLDWPNPGVVYLGMVMVAEPFQGQGIATQAWNLLSAWLAAGAHMKRARLGVEQFNHGALKFFEKLGFTLTGESNRLRVGDKFVRLLYMERELSDDYRSVA
jgi:RimJ/RimL family protein N-acetyltransferase